MAASTAVSIRVVASLEESEVNMNKKDIGYGSSLFDMEDTKGNRKFSVIFAKYLREEKLYASELFEGFCDIKAITASHSISFMCKLPDKIRKSELIFGYPEISGNQQLDFLKIQGLQSDIIRIISREGNINNIITGMSAGYIKLFVSRDIIPHENIYILSALNGDKRVIIGSDRMSAPMFMGYQRDGFVIFDDEVAYSFYLKKYIEFRDNCCDIVLPELLKEVKDNSNAMLKDPKKIPINKAASEGTINIEQDKDYDSDKISEIGQSEKDIRGNNDDRKTKRIISTIKTIDNGREKITLTKEVVNEISETTRDAYLRREKEFSKASLSVDFENMSLILGGEPMNLNPSSIDIKNDGECLIRYFKGFESFSGDVDYTRREFYKFAVWTFASPFIPYLRYLCFENGLDPNFKYPVYGLIYGQSNCGKSKFLQFLNRMMCGMDSIPDDNVKFTRTEVIKLKEKSTGLPIIIDDIKENSFRNNIEFVKEERWGFKDKRDRYSCVSMTANQLPPVDKAIKKRVVICKATASVSLQDASKDVEFDKLLHQPGSAFYREYFKRMTPVVRDLEKHIYQADLDYKVSLLANSSRVIKEILHDYCDRVPEYFCELSNYEDYFGTSVLFYESIKSLQIALKTEPQQFVVDTDEDLLIYSFPPGSNKYSNNLVKVFKELPTEWLADEIGNCLKVQYSAVIRGGINCSGIRRVSDGWFKKMVNKL